jgi:hypothetical protein
MSSLLMESTRECGGPFCSHLEKWPSFSSGPSAQTSTTPSTVLRTQPLTPKRNASCTAEYLKPTPCTLPLTLAKKAMDSTVFFFSAAPLPLQF